MVGCQHRNHLGGLADPRWIAVQAKLPHSRRSPASRQGLSGDGPSGSVRRRDGSRSGSRGGTGSQADQQRPAADLRRRPGGRRLLQPRRPADGVPERTRGRAIRSSRSTCWTWTAATRSASRPATARPRAAGFTPTATACCSPRRTRTRTHERNRPRNSNCGNPARNGATRGTTTSTTSCTRSTRRPASTTNLTEHARLRRGRFVVAGRPLDRVHLQPPGVHRADDGRADRSIRARPGLHERHLPDGRRRRRTSGG